MSDPTSTIRECTRCGIVKPLSEYYRNRAAKHGRESHCKSCSKEKSRAYHAVNPRREYQAERCERDKKRRRTDTEWLIQYRARKRLARIGKPNSKKDPRKTSAHRAVYRATQRGKIVPAESCERCGHDFTLYPREGHHQDYSKPLEIEWLCSICHADEHYGAAL